jgi:oligoendopeptidase F
MEKTKIIREKLEWNLDDILKVEEFDELAIQIKTNIEKLANKIKELKPEMAGDKFAEIVELDENNSEDLSRLIHLPHLMESVDQKNQTAKLLKSKAEDLWLKSEEVSRRLYYWIKGKQVPDLNNLDDTNAKRLFNSIPDLKFQLLHQRQAAKYSLSEPEENIAKYKSIFGIGALKDMRRILETEFEYKLEVKNRKPKIIKNQAELMSLVHDKKTEVRKAAYKSLLKTHEKNIDKLFLIYQSVVKDWNFERRLRGYSSPISIRNFENHISDQTIEVLLESGSKNKNLFQEYFKYKAKLMGFKKLKRFDIYAPTGKSSKNLTLSEAKDLVLDTFNKFSPNFYNLALKIINEKHIDSHPDKNKRSGAFCATVSPKVTPYIMTNFTGQLRDVSTLAHELGHGIHSLLSNKHSYSSQSASLPLAETASTLAEMILFEEIYKNEKDNEVKKSMLREKIEDSYATILRQNYFVKFEIEAHKKIIEGITVKDLSEIYLNNLKDQFGDSVEIDNSFKYEWSYIPHMVDTPFYCYSYNFGELLSYSIYKNYKEQGPDYIRVIEKILSYGGSEDPQKILKKEGLDIEDPRFWQNSFEIIKNWQKELIELF